MVLLASHLMGSYSVTNEFRFIGAFVFYHNYEVYMNDSDSSLFDLHLLLLGASCWIEQRQAGDFNLPDMTRWALNRLHAMQVERKENPTVSQEETLHYLTRPLQELFESIVLPESLTAYSILDNFPVETEFDLADGVQEYLQEKNLAGISSIQAFVETDENNAAQSIQRSLSKRYQAAGLSDTERLAIEEEYVKWRSFFTIERLVVNPAQNGLLFDSFWHKIRDEFYEPAQLLHPRIIIQNAKKEPVYLISPNSGLLYRNVSGAFQPITVSPEFEGVEQAIQQAVKEGDFVLKQTHQRRILIPGIPEHRLFEALKGFPQVRELRLYPGVDRYDLRLRLQNGEVHALDVKDHRRPYALEQQLGKRALPQIAEHEQSLLGYDVFVYLIPQSRVNNYPNGLVNLKRIAQRATNLLVMSIEEYLEELSHV
jgi:hypothetical protein